LVYETIPEGLKESVGLVKIFGRRVFSDDCSEITMHKAVLNAMSGRMIKLMAVGPVVVMPSGKGLKIWLIDVVRSGVEIQRAEINLKALVSECLKNVPGEH
jgi:hypothetical protein